MKKIVPFKKKLSFDTNVSEITSISLENNLRCDGNSVIGDLIINGSYKITDSSIKTDSFEFNIPSSIEVDDKYVMDDVIIDIDDFYYEIINNNVLEVSIDILLDNLVERPVLDVDLEEEIDVANDVDNLRCIEDEVSDEIVDKSVHDVKLETDIFSNFNNDNEDYATYYVYIVREGDTIDSILARYEISKDDLMEYNDLSELKLGDKLIIPKANV